MPTIHFVKTRLPRVIPFFALLLWAQSRGLGQGSKEDYARAMSLGQRIENKVFRDSVKPVWLPGNTSFWYRVAVGPDSVEYVFVDAASGRRQPLFDRDRLNQSLAQAAGSNPGGLHGSLDPVEYQPAENRLVFHWNDKRWRCRLAGYEVTEEPDAPPGAPSGRQAIPRASVRTGARTKITFVNKTAGICELFWVDSGGIRKSYGKVRPGGESTLSTYAGHVWAVVDLEGKTLQRFLAEESPVRAVIDGRSEPEAADASENREGNHPGHLSPDGNWTLRFADQNVRLVDTKSGEEFPLTYDGTTEDAYTEAAFWSPDSSHLVLLRVQPAQEHKVHFLESTPKDQLQPILHTVDYLKPGDRVAHPRPYLFEVRSRRRIAIDESLYPNPYELDEVRWAADSRQFTFVYNQRGHQVFRVIGVRAADGKATAVVDERSETFIDYAGKRFLHWLERTNELIWMSERDGWNHLWLYDSVSGSVKTQITRGEWVVNRVLQVDENERRIWFLAGGVKPGEDPYHRHLCRVNLDGSGFVRLTQGDGTHSVEFSPDHRYFLDTWSRVDQPPTIELRRSEDGTLVVELERADASGLLAAGWTLPERVVAKGRDGSTDIYGILIRPSNFDPTRHYPVVEEVYAGPQDAYVPKSFERLIRQHAMAELGFIVVQVDGKGTSGRSKAFHNTCWKNLADAGFPDRIAWIRAAAEKRPWMDLIRVGTYGGSAGGQNAVRALIDHHDFYRVAVADCGCHDNRMDKIWWNELWMGWPIGPEYVKCSNAAQADKLEGKLLLMVGEMDTNVDPASTMQVVSALEKANKDFDLIVMTGAGHGSAETPYGSRRRMDYLVRHLLGREPRWE
jgi:dipeptidyl aminopeptidase/acylaminoacyl peptidase